MEQNKTRLWNRAFLIAFGSILLSGFAMNMLNSTMARYIYSIYGNATYSGVLNAAFAVMAILARLVAGDLADRKGRGVVMLAGGAIFAVAIFGFGMFPWLAALIIFRALQGFGYATGSTGAYAAGSDSLPANRMSEGIGYLSLGYSLAMAIGPMIALNLIIGTNYLPVFLAAGLLMIFAVLLSVRYMRAYEKAPRAEQQRRKITLSRFVERKALPASSAQLFNCIAQSAINSYIVIFADSRGIAGTAYFFTFMAVSMCLTRALSGRLGDKYGFRAVIVPAVIMNVLGFSTLIACNATPAFYAAGFMLGIGQGIFGPAMQTVAVQASPDDRRGVANSTFQLANDASNGVGAVIWGIVIDSFGYNMMLSGCIAAALVSLLLSFTVVRKDRAA